MRFRALRHLGGALVTAVLLVTSVVIGPTPVHAQELDVAEVRGDVTYAVDPVNARVGVTVRLTVRHVGDDAAQAITSVSLALPAVAGATIAASRNGQPVEVVAVGPEVGEFSSFAIDVGRELRPGQATELLVTYTLVAPVEEVPAPSATRLNAAYVSFPARGVGDEGAGSVQVVMPFWFDTVWIDADPSARPVGLVTVFEVRGVGAEFSGIVEGRDDAALVRAEVTGVDADVATAAWPGDERWAAQIGDQVRRLLPALEERVGAPWPLRVPLTIREGNAGVVHGYAGAFVGRSDGAEVEVGAVVDPADLAHELAHAWFDSSLDPWLAEGFAEELAQQAIEALGGPRRAAADAFILPGDVAEAPLLVGWEPFAGENAVDRAAYTASAELMETVAGEVGADELVAVVASLRADSSVVDDWQRFLDAAERAGSTSAERLLVARVVGRGAEDVLTERRDADAAVAELAATSGDWGVPTAIVEARAAWDFERLRTGVNEATGILEDRDVLVARAAGLGLRSPAAAGEVYATDPTAAVAHLDRRRSALDAIEAATVRLAASRDRWEQIGLWGEDLDPLVDEAGRAFEGGEQERAVETSARVLAVLDEAGDRGRRRVAGAVAVVALVLLVGVIARFGRARRRAVAR